MAEKTGAREGDLLIFGHTHKAWQKQIDGIHFVNAGSVGRPKDGDWRACYVLLHFGNSEPVGGSGGTDGEAVLRVEHVRVEYDLTRAQAGIRESDLPNEFAEILETAGSLKT
jgi:diadenosine tetraphosphatase ApaH/serine/threonine PP2A family protein phosphatase